MIYVTKEFSEIFEKINYEVQKEKLKILSRKERLIMIYLTGLLCEVNEVIIENFSNDSDITDVIHDFINNNQTSDPDLNEIIKQVGGIFNLSFSHVKLPSGKDLILPPSAIEATKLIRKNFIKKIKESK